jgi:probable phosphoglycerate mutase
VVTHVTPIKMLVRAALEAPLSSIYRMYLDTASVSVIDYPADGTAALRLFNDTSHDTSRAE